MINIRFNYVYRDASNYKQYGSVIFSDPDGVISHLQDAENRIRTALKPDGTFNANQVRLPEVFLYEPGNADDDDHCLHEFVSLESAPDEPNDDCNRTFKSFLLELEEQARPGWTMFDPHTPRSVSQVATKVSEASKILAAAVRLSDATPNMAGIAFRLRKMSREADDYSQYLALYFSRGDQV